VFHFGEQVGQIGLQLPHGKWRPIFASAATSSFGRSAISVSAHVAMHPRSFVILENINPKSEQ
jgi:hypothetical protein